MSLNPIHQTIEQIKVADLALDEIRGESTCGWSVEDQWDLGFLERAVATKDSTVELGQVVFFRASTKHRAHVAENNEIANAVRWEIKFALGLVLPHDSITALEAAEVGRNLSDDPLQVVLVGHLIDVDRCEPTQGAVVSNVGISDG